MASGSGKNQGGIQTKEPVPPAPPSERLREEPNAAAAAAAATEPHPPAPPSECLQERTHGSPEAGGQNTPAAAAAEAAAAAQRNGTGIEAPSRRGSADGKLTLSPRAASTLRARELKPAGGKPPLPRCPAPASKSKGKMPMSHAEVMESGKLMRAKWKEMREGRIDMEEEFNELLLESKKTMPEGTVTQQKEQTNPKLHGIVKQQKDQLVQHKNKTIREMDRKAKPEGTVKQRKGKQECRRIDRRWSRLFIILLLFCCLPTVTAFQRFPTLDKAADHLGRHPYLQQMQADLVAEEAHGRRILCWTAGAIAAASFLLGEFVVGVGQEAETNMAGMAASVVLAVVIIVLIVTLRFVVRRA